MTNSKVRNRARLAIATRCGKFLIRIILLSGLFEVGLGAGLAWACACGCGVFEVGTSSLFPAGTGGTAWVEYDFMDQYLNFHASHQVSAGDNGDRVLRTNFSTVGLQYMFSRDWGAMIQAPYWQRYWKGVGDNGQINGFSWNSIGDIRIEGMYTGLSEDMSTGLLGGIKVPSGWYTYPHVDRDNQIGTGSTDLIVGAYHWGNLPLSLENHQFNWYIEGSYDLPVFTQDHYKPGREFDGALGLTYNLGTVAFLKEIAPLVALVGSDRVRDSQSQADPTNTGYSRLLITPGIETKLSVIRWYTDIGIPIYQNVNGDQITAPYLLKTVLSYDF